MDVAARNLATPKKARNAPPPRLPHPWEYPGERPGQPPVPKWNYWQPDIIARMRVSAQRVFDRIPTEIYKFGQRKQAALIRDWLADPKDASFLREVAHRLVFRIVCTLRRQRKTEHQTETLAALALDDTIASIQAEQPEYSEFVKRELADHRNAYARLAQELVYLCKDNYLEEDQT